MQDREAAAERLGRFLRERREAHGWKVENLARRGGMDKSYLSRIERGAAAGRTKAPPRETLEKIAVAYQVTVADLERVVAGEVVLPSPKLPLDQAVRQFVMVMPVAVPVIEHPAHAGHSGGAVIDYVYVDRSVAANRNLVCIPVKGDCMAPRIRDGDRVIVDRDLWPKPGQVVVAVVNEEVWVRRFFLRNGDIVLRADNPEYSDIPAAEGDIVGVMVQGTYVP